MALNNTKFITGNQAVVEAATNAGAQVLCGYPITPTTEILEYWAKTTIKNPKLKFFQAEDEMSAGFATIGAVLAGARAFTTTAGPGNVLMQDAFSMAEAMRIPMVAIIMSRGGPSTGTVIYSQQEVTLTCFGGNGEGLRIVYSPATSQELYDYTIKAFNSAWKYQFPTFVLGDGYLAKALSEVKTNKPDYVVKTFPHLLTPKKNPKKYINLVNTFEMEEDLAQNLASIKEAYDNFRHQIIEYESTHTDDADLVIFAHGSVGGAVKTAVDLMRENGMRVGLFRPITLLPFPKYSARQVASDAKKIMVVESSFGQFAKLLKDKIYGVDTELVEFYKPAEGFTPEEIISKASKVLTRINE